MTKLVTSFLVLFSLVFSGLTYAIDPYAAVPENHRKVISNIEKNLNFEFTDNSKRLAFYNQQLKVHLETNNWHYQTMAHNGMLAKTENWKGDDYFLNFVIAHTDRHVFFNIFLSKENKSLYVGITEVLSSALEPVLETYNKLIKDPESDTLYDRNTHSMFNRKGYITYTNYHVKNNTASVVYSTGSSFEY